MRRSVRRVGGAGGPDPLGGLANLFDVGVILAVGLMALAMQSGAQKESAPSGAVETIEDLRPTANRTLSGRGERLGVAYRLDSGGIIYVPEEP